MEGIPFKRKGRWFQAILVTSITFCAMLPYIAPSILMGDIMQTYGCDQGTAGLSMTAQLAMFGVCMFIGSFIVDKLGKVNTLKLGMCCVFAGVLISGLAPNVAVFIFARAVAGFGQGMTAANNAMLAAWFEGREQSFAVTVNTMGSAIALAISVAICRPVADALGGWQKLMLAYAAFTAVFVVLWLIFGKDSPEGAKQEKEQKEKAAAAGRSRSSLSMALKDPQCWFLMVFLSVFTIVDTARATFLPTYMTSVGIPEGVMTTAVSILSIAGMIGSFLGGVIVARFRRRKPVLCVSVAAYIVCGLCVTLFSQAVPNALFTVALGFFYNFPMTAATMLMIEYCMAKDPAMISGAAAMMSGVGMLLTLCISPVFTALSGALGMAGAFRVFFAAAAVSLGITFFVRETGKAPVHTET